MSCTSCRPKQRVGRRGFQLSVGLRRPAKSRCPPSPRCPRPRQRTCRLHVPSVGNVRLWSSVQICCVRFLSLLSTHFISEMSIPLNWCIQSMHESFEAIAKLAKILVGHHFFHVQRSVLNSRNYTIANMGSKTPYVQVTEII